MTTTIKVSNELRDRLKVHAAERGHTIGDYIGALVDEADRRARFDRLRAQIAATPAHLQSTYRNETAVWDSASGDGLDAEDFSDWPGYATT